MTTIPPSDESSGLQCWLRTRFGSELLYGHHLRQITEDEAMAKLNAGLSEHERILTYSPAGFSVSNNHPRNDVGPSENED